MKKDTKDFLIGAAVDIIVMILVAMFVFAVLQVFVVLLSPVKKLFL